jgi:hypothetical protein
MCAAINLATPRDSKSPRSIRRTRATERAAQHIGATDGRPRIREHRVCKVLENLAAQHLRVLAPEHDGALSRSWCTAAGTAGNTLSRSTVRPPVQRIGGKHQEKNWPPLVGPYWSQLSSHMQCLMVWRFLMSSSMEGSSLSARLIASLVAS